MVRETGFEDSASVEAPGETYRKDDSSDAESFEELGGTGLGVGEDRWGCGVLGCAACGFISA